MRSSGPPRDPRMASRRRSRHCRQDRQTPTPSGLASGSLSRDGASRSRRSPNKRRAPRSSENRRIASVSTGLLEQHLPPVDQSRRARRPDPARQTSSASAPATVGSAGAGSVSRRVSASCHQVSRICPTIGSRVVRSTAPSASSSAKSAASAGLSARPRIADRERPFGVFGARSQSASIPESIVEASLTMSLQ